MSRLDQIFPCPSSARYFDNGMAGYAVLRSDLAVSPASAIPAWPFYCLANFAHLILRQFCTGLSQPSPIPRIAGVFFGRADAKVSKVAAWGVVAGVQKKRPLGDRPIFKFPKSAVRASVSVANFEPPVSEVGLRSSPNNTPAFNRFEFVPYLADFLAKVMAGPRWLKSRAAFTTWLRWINGLFHGEEFTRGHL